ncbi:MAG: translocation/assembly module TamB [Bacteroidota bacterium]|nr:translocation/assembly module TamB [Bacteroidota bacterium]
MQVIKKGIVKTMFWTIAFFFLVLFFSIVSLHHPYIQTKVVKKVTGLAESKIGFPVNIDFVNLRWFDVLLLEGVEIVDMKGNSMIYVNKLSVDFNIASLLDEKNFNLDHVVINGAKINLIRNTDDEDLNINLFIKRIRELASPKTPSGKKAPIFSIDEITLEDAFFSLNDPHEDSIRGSFDYYHFQIDSINADIKNLRVIADTFEIDILKMYGHNPTNNMRVNNLKSFFRFSESSIEFSQLDLSVGNSHIKDSIVFFYDQIADLNRFNESVHIVAHLDNTSINSQDLALFAPALRPYYDDYVISGNFNGKVGKFTMKDFNLKFGNNSSFSGVLNIDGLPNIEESFIETRLQNSSINTADIKKYIPAGDYEKIQKFGMINFSGQFLGFPNDFVANGTFYTDLGKLVSDINLKVEEDSKYSTYRGNLSAYNFDLGKFTEEPGLLQKITMSGSVDGKGFTLESAELKLNATINSLGINGYNYTNIKTNARFAKELFEGKLNIADPNIKFSANGSIDMRGKQNVFKVEATLDTAILLPLNLSKEKAIISSKFKLNLQGSEIDNIVGDASFFDAYVVYKENDIYIDSLKIHSQKENNSRYVSLESDLFDLDAAGNFDYTVLFDDIKKLVVEYKLNFMNNEEDIARYYGRKSLKNIPKYSLDYAVSIKNINPLLNLFEESLYINPNTTLEGRFTSGYTSIFSLNTNIDTIFYKNNEFYNNEIDITSSKIADSTNVLASVFLFSGQQKFSSLTLMEQMSFEGIWNDDHIEFLSSIKQKGTENLANVLGSIEFLSDRTELKFHDSEFQVIEQSWRIREDNRIVFDDGEIFFENLKLFNGEQNISVNGVLADSLDKKLTVAVEKFQLEMLNPLLEQKFSGVMNGQLDLKNGLGDFILESEVGVKALRIDNFLVGDITGSSIWDKDLDKLNLSLEVFRVDRKTVDITGSFTPAEQENQLDLLAKFDQANLNIIEPFAEGVFSKIAGVASGEFKIIGMLNYPILKGEGIIEGGRFTIDYLNTHYSYSGKFLFDDNEIGVRDMRIYDDNNNLAVLNGGVFHDGFRNFVLDLQSDLYNFKVLNTTYKDNDLYYGTAIVSGHLEILGDVNNLNFNANATTNKGSKLFIPISNSGGVDQKDFINFVNFKDTVNLISKNDPQNISTSGIKLNFDLDITPDAYCEIIFDIKSGDIIRGRGTGKLNLQIDTKGDFNMFGDYEIQEGAYNFTLYNIINKEFKIQSGSKISWYGDPYHAQMDIDAVYEQLASLLPLLPEANNENGNTSVEAQLKRRYPARVYLYLEGDLLAPDIAFNIDILNYPESNTTLYDVVNRFKIRIRDDKTELEKQVFSLIILRRFSSEENTFGYGSAIGNSVSELLSNQLSYWVTQFDENLEIDVDMGAMDADVLNTLQLRLAYTFLDGRLRISRDGGFTNVNNQADINSIAGEWTVEYMLTPDGKFRAKVFNRINYNLMRLDDNVATSAGFSVLHVESFDTLKEIFKKNRAKNRKPDPLLLPEDEEEETQPEVIIQNNKNEDGDADEAKSKKKANIN